MAVWQVDFSLAPRKAIADVPRPLSQAAVGSQWWAAVPMLPDYRQRLALAAPPGDSGVAGVETWGAPDGNRVDVRSAGGRVVQVIVRVDARRPDPKFAAGLLGFVRAANAVLVRADGLVAEPTVTSFTNALRGSEAWRAVAAAAAVRTRRVEPEDE